MTIPEDHNSVFHFKQVKIRHSRSSMKVGVDGVLIGAWGRCEGQKGLDIGCGCGLIALMAAQRNPECHVTGIDIDADSVSEAMENFEASPWKDRLKAFNVDASNFSTDKGNQNKFDFILTNPPFFNSGISSPSTPREMARHISSLTPHTLFKIGLNLLDENGTLSLILPIDFRKEIVSNPFLKVEKICNVSDNPAKKPKRVMAQLRKTSLDKSLYTREFIEEDLFIRDDNGEYSHKYRDLTSPFYLKF